MYMCAGIHKSLCVCLLVRLLRIELNQLASHLIPIFLVSNLDRISRFLIIIFYYNLKRKEKWLQIYLKLSDLNVSLSTDTVNLFALIDFCKCNSQ